MPHNNGVPIFLEGIMSFVGSIYLSQFSIKFHHYCLKLWGKHIHIKTFIKVHLISTRQVNMREMSKMNSLRVI